MRAFCTHSRCFRMCLCARCFFFIRESFFLCSVPFFLAPVIQVFQHMNRFYFVSIASYAIKLKRKTRRSTKKKLRIALDMNVASLELRFEHVALDCSEN